MKLIFLDIDGVLRCSKYGNLNTRMIDSLKTIIDAHNAKLVLISPHKLGWLYLDNKINSEKTNEFVVIRDEMKEFGLEFYSRTPSITKATCGDEIDVWLRKSNEKIDSFIILSSNSDVDPYANRLIQTKFDIGLCENLVNKAIEMLYDVNME